MRPTSRSHTLFEHWGRPALPLVLLALMGLIVAYPLLRPVMVCGADFPGHLAHAVELDRLTSQGIWYPRWAPDFVFGYGYPTFNFYPPLPRYLAVALHRLGLPLRDAVNSSMALALMLAGPAMYVLARSIYGERAGMAAGLAFVFAPYLANDALQRYALGETLALSLMPIVFWALARLGTDSRHGQWRVVIAALACAALILLHSLLALIFAPLLAAYLILVWWTAGRPRVMIWRVALAGLLALGLTAFFWLPYIVQVSLVQMWRATILDLTGELLYPLNFITLLDLIWPRMLWPDYGLGDPLVQRFLALPQLALALVGLALMQRRPWRLARTAAIMFGLATLAAAFFIIPASRPLWDKLPALQIIQFPWRLLAPASFSLALLAGVGWSCLGERFSNAPSRIRVAALDAVLVALCVMWTLPWVRPFTCSIQSNPAASFLLWVDRNHIGGGSGGEFLPRWVETEPTGSPLEPALLAGGQVDRLDRTSLPDGATARMLTSKPLASAWEISSRAAISVRFDNFYYRGWNVYVDDKAVPIAPAPSTGLIVADIPPGQHVVSLRLDSTREQTLSCLVSLSSVLAALAVCIAPGLAKAGSLVPTNATGESTRVPGWEWAALAVIGAVMLVGKSALASIAPPGPTIPPTASRLAIDLSQKVQLVGYELSSTTIQPSQPLTVTLYWQAPELLLTSFKSFVHVTNADGNMVTQSDAVPANWTRPTTAWLPGEQVADPHTLRLPSSPAGQESLQVWAGMYDPNTLQRLLPPGNQSGLIKLGNLAP